MGATKAGKGEVSMDEVDTVNAGGSTAEVDAQLADVGFGGMELTPLANSLWEQVCMSANTAHMVAKVHVLVGVQSLFQPQS